MALPSKCSYARPQALEVYIPQVHGIKICVYVQEAGQAREMLTKIGMARGIDMSVRQLHNRLEGVPCAKRASGAERERL